MTPATAEETPEAEPTPEKVKPNKALPALKATYKPTPASIAQAEENQAPVPKKGRITPPPAETPAPSPADNTDKPTVMTGDVPFVPTPSPETKSTPPMITEADESKTKARYYEIKTTALEDKEIKALKDKADAAGDKDQATASRVYYKALFKKMRTLDPSLTDHIDRMEKAMMKKLGGDAQ